jgi:hypothetical protein
MNVKSASSDMTRGALDVFGAGVDVFGAAEVGGIIRDIIFGARDLRPSRNRNR